MRIVSPLLKHAVYPAMHRVGWLARIHPNSGYAVVNYHGVVPSDHVPSDHSSSDRASSNHSGAESFLDGNLVRPEVLRKQLQFLKKDFEIIHPEDFRGWVEQDKPLPPRAVLLTCDDGLLNTLTDMLPVLRSEGVFCLFFVTGASSGDDPGKLDPRTLWPRMLCYEELYRLMQTGALSESDLELPAEAEPESSSKTFQDRWWRTVRRASRLNAAARSDWMNRVRSHCGAKQSLGSERRWRLLNITELRLLSDAGMSIGAHTSSHPILSLCSDEEARREIQESKIELERALGRTVWAFAYPFGNPSTMGEREIRLAREARYACAFLNVEHWGSAPSDRFAIPRTHVTSQTTLAEFAAHLSGLHNRLQRAVGG
jgi:peptidoglycan/xylan/chitin deacetylase (PgdA/CDA1 family)